MTSRFWIELTRSLTVGASFAFLLTGIAWYGFILKSNETNSKTLQKIEISVSAVVDENQRLIENNAKMLKEIQASMEDRTTRLDEIKALLEKKPN